MDIQNFAYGLVCARRYCVCRGLEIETMELLSGFHVSADACRYPYLLAVGAAVI